jgi:NADPH:quinone reductase-like Zn-dependent oxidoreductase
VDFEQALASGPKFDLILDPIGGSNWARNLRLLRKGGRLVCLGMSENSGSRSLLFGMLKMFLQVPWGLVNPLTLMRDNRGISGMNMADLGEESIRMADWMKDVIRLWSGGRVRPLVHAAVPFSRAAESHRILHARENIGKVVLVPDPCFTEG